MPLVVQVEEFGIGHRSSSATTPRPGTDIFIQYKLSLIRAIRMFTASELECLDFSCTSKIPCSEDLITVEAWWHRLLAENHVACRLVKEGRLLQNEAKR